MEDEFMNVKRQRAMILLVSISVLLIAVGSVQAQVTKFSTDVSTAIDRGLAWLAPYYNNPSGTFPSASYGRDNAGLVALALLEKRVSADQSSQAQGYDGASATDKVKIENIMTFIINFPGGSNGTGFYAYRNGQEMMALSVYLRTTTFATKVGGPTKAQALAALNQAFDESVPATLDTTWNGYWDYYDSVGTDSSTTQLIMSGLAAAKSVYTHPDYTDVARTATLNKIVAKTRAAYAANGRNIGCQNSARLTASEKGHGYNVGYDPSQQQTAAGTWIQLVGGANINDAGVQSYLEWLRNRYNYQNTTAGSCQSSWGEAYHYYLWSSSKAYTFLDESGVSLDPGKLDTNSLGALPALAAPAFATRLGHLDPETVARPVVFGPGGANYYNGGEELPRWYFDYAYTLISRQNASGQLLNPNGSWSTLADQAYALLVLVRSTGGGCVDSDGDGVCDSTDNCKNVQNVDQLDTDGDKIGNACDRCPTRPGLLKDEGCPLTQPVKLNVATSPSSGRAGITPVNITGAGFPTTQGAIAAGSVTINFHSTSCQGSVAASSTGTMIRVILGSTSRVTTLLPGTLTPGTYFASIAGTTANGTLFDSGDTCSQVVVVAAP